MDRAYLFPRNVEVKKENIGQAEAISIAADYHRAYQAASYNRLRCTYVHCFGRLNPFRKDADVDVIGHFAHEEEKIGSPYCPLRTLSFGTRIGTGGGGTKYRDNMRKLIESQLYRELLNKLGPTARVSMSDSHDREPRIQIDGLARPLLILAIAPHDEQLWKEPFDGTVEGRQVLFFISSLDLPKLVAKEINEKLLAKSSTITVSLPTRDGQDFTFAILDQISSGQSAPASSALEQLDLIYVDYKKLFAAQRTSEYLFIRTSHRSPIESFLEKIEKIPDTPARKLLQLLAKRLLVESTHNHRIAFRQSLQEARQFFRPSDTFPSKGQLIEYSEVPELIASTFVQAATKDHPLPSLYAQFVSQAVEAMRNSIKSLEDASSKLAQEWETKSKEMSSSIETLEKKRKALGQQLAEKQKEYEEERGRRKQFEAESNELRIQLAEATRERDVLNKRWREKEKEFEAQEGQRKKLENDLQKLKNNKFSRLILKIFDIDPR